MSLHPSTVDKSHRPRPVIQRHRCASSRTSCTAWPCSGTAQRLELFVAPLPALPTPLIIVCKGLLNCRKAYMFWFGVPKARPAGGSCRISAVDDDGTCPHSICVTFFFWHPRLHIYSNGSAITPRFARILHRSAAVAWFASLQSFSAFSTLLVA